VINPFRNKAFGCRIFSSAAIHGLNDVGKKTGPIQDVNRPLYLTRYNIIRISAAAGVAPAGINIASAGVHCTTAACLGNRAYRTAVILVFFFDVCIFSH
jgi:hypothetical protein